MPPRARRVGQTSNGQLNQIWLTRNGGCLLAHNKGQIPPKDLRDIMDVVTFNHKLICDEWHERFQGDISFYV